MELDDSDSADYIDEWDNELSVGSGTSGFYSVAKHHLMVKSSPRTNTSIDDGGRKPPRLLENSEMSAIERADKEEKGEWPHEELCDYLRDSDPKVGIKGKRTKMKKRIQIYIYNFLERPSGAKCIAYHVTVFLMVVACLICSAISTVESLNDTIMPMLLTMEYVMVVFFALEYCVRLWSAGSIGKYKGFYGRLRFARKPIFLLDLFVVIASTVVLLFSQNGNVFATSAVRGIRFLQILRILHMDRQGGTWRLLGSVVYIHRQELITTLYIGFLALILSSYFVYLAEKPDDTENHGNSSIFYNNRFDNYADALWWGVVTVTTIGYGDLVPKTWVGKVVASCFSIFAISFFALPAGILGSGFALKVQQKQRQKQFNRQIPAAATLIQASWRCYATRRGSNCWATWKLYALPTRHRNDSTMSATKSKTRRDSHKSKRSDSVVPTHKSISPANWDDVIHEVMSSSESEPLSLPASYKTVVRALRVLIFLVRKKEFHHCRKPYDVRDVFEQYSHGYVNITVRLKELQRRMDQTLGKPTSFNDDNVYGSDRRRQTVGFRLRRLEMKVDRIERKLDEILRRFSLVLGQRGQDSPSREDLQSNV